MSGPNLTTLCHITPLWCCAPRRTLSCPARSTATKWSMRTPMDIIRRGTRCRQQPGVIAGAQYSTGACRSVAMLFTLPSTNRTHYGYWQPTGRLPVVFQRLVSPPWMR